jgi:hypothetical protein
MWHIAHCCLRSNIVLNSSELHCTVIIRMCIYYCFTKHFLFAPEQFVSHQEVELPIQTSVDLAIFSLHVAEFPPFLQCSVEVLVFTMSV